MAVAAVAAEVRGGGVEALARRHVDEDPLVGARKSLASAAQQIVIRARVVQVGEEAVDCRAAGLSVRAQASSNRQVASATVVKTVWVKVEVAGVAVVVVAAVAIVAAVRNRALLLCLPRFASLFSTNNPKHYSCNTFKVALCRFSFTQQNMLSFSHPPLSSRRWP